MSEEKKAFKSQKSYKGSEMQAFCTGYEMAAYKYKATIKQLESELEEERQENASLRSGDDYERGAE